MAEFLRNVTVSLFNSSIRTLSSSATAHIYKKECWPLQNRAVACPLLDTQHASSLQQTNFTHAQPGSCAFGGDSRGKRTCMQERKEQSTPVVEFLHTKSSLKSLHCAGFHTITNTFDIHSCPWRNPSEQPIQELGQRILGRHRVLQMPLFVCWREREEGLRSAL